MLLHAAASIWRCDLAANATTIGTESTGEKLMAKKLRKAGVYADNFNY